MNVDGHEIAIETSVKNGATWVVGSVDGREVISLGNGTDEGWTVGSSATLPRSLSKARATLQCMNMALQTAEEQGRQQAA